MWAWIVITLLNTYDISYLLMLGFDYTLPLNNDNLLMFWKHLSYGFGFDYIAITFTLYNVLYDWWLDPGQSRSQAVILRRWILGV